MGVSLINYLPLYWQDSAEMNAIQNCNNTELDLLYSSSKAIFSDCLILRASESRIKQWEKVLEIVPDGTLADRRVYVLSILRGVGKLNESKIKTIVKTFTGGDSIVTFANSTINVKVLPPHNGAVYRFPDIERSIEKQKPAHLGLVVERFYSTWGDIKEQFSSWQDVNESEQDWLAVYNHIIRE